MGTVRSFFNSIFLAIYEATLTDEEYESIEGLGLIPDDYSQINFKIAESILIGRDVIDSSTKKLEYYFMAKGATESDVGLQETGFTNIFLGSPL